MPDGATLGRVDSAWVGNMYVIDEPDGGNVYKFSNLTTFKGTDYQGPWPRSDD
jgi:hypothetical protein